MESAIQIGFWINLTASVVSVVLAILAICFSIYFYRKSKDTERSVSNALAEIKAQTDALQKITGRQLDRLTRYATQPKLGEEVLAELAGAVKEIRTDLSSQLQPLKEAAQAELVSAYIAIYYYAGMSNSLSGWLLVTFGDILDADRTRYWREALDGSYRDYFWMADVIRRVGESTIQKNPLNVLYKEARDQWATHMKNSAMLSTPSG